MYKPLWDFTWPNASVTILAPNYYNMTNASQGTTWTHFGHTPRPLKYHSENMQRTFRREHAENTQRSCREHLLHCLSAPTSLDGPAGEKQHLAGHLMLSGRSSKVFFVSDLPFNHQVRIPSILDRVFEDFGLPRKSLFWFSPASRSLAALKVDKFLCIWVLQAPGSVSRLQTKNWSSHCAEF